MKEEKKEKKEEKVEAIDFVSKLVPPHHKKSIKVTNKHIPKLMEDAKIMYNLCYTKVGWMPGSYAIHHAQIESEHPLNFFVTADKEIIINPVIVNHTKVAISRKEGCTSFPENPPTMVDRYHKIQVEYQTLEPDATISKKKTKDLKGIDAQIWQHECQHGEAKYIYEF